MKPIQASSILVESSSLLLIVHARASNDFANATSCVGGLDLQIENIFHLSDEIIPDWQ